jgi:transglutaminase-like putative cysteine protease
VLFENPQKVRKMKFKLSGVSAERIKGFPWGDGSQELIKAEGDSFLIRTYSRIFNEKEACVFPLKSEELQAALKPSVFCQADAPEIVEAANNIIGTERNSWRAAKKIAEWVDKNMTPNYDVGFASAKEIFNNRKGDCSEYTVLFISLCRAVGIPARASVGIMYGGGLFAYHMWPEVYVGEWVSLDAKWLAVDKASGEYYTDATHLKFGHSNLDENMFKEMITSISEIIGKLKIEILDYSER